MVDCTLHLFFVVYLLYGCAYARYEYGRLWGGVQSVVKCVIYIISIKYGGSL